MMVSLTSSAEVLEAVRCPILQCSTTRCSPRDPLSHEGHQHQKQAPRIRSVRPEIPRTIRHHIIMPRASSTQLLPGRSSNTMANTEYHAHRVWLSSATDEQSSRTANCNRCVYLHCRGELHPAATFHDAVEISGPMVSQPHAVERIPPIKLAVRSPRQFAHWATRLASSMSGANCRAHVCSSLGISFQ